MRQSPCSIIVTVDLNLYIADSSNDRVQLFKASETNGTAIVSNETLDLSCQTGLALDSDGYLFITDYNNHCIIGSGSNRFQCIAGCSDRNDSTSDHLLYPQSLRFDTFENIYVVNDFNHRIQRFILPSNSCGKRDN